MNTTAAAAKLYRMLKVKHFVIDNVLDGVARYPLVVEGAAHHDGIVSRIIMRKASAGVRLAPRHPRSAQQTVKEALVEFFKDLLQVVYVPLRGNNSFSSAQLSHPLRLSADIVAGNIAAITSGVEWCDGPAIDFGEQNVSDRL